MKLGIVGSRQRNSMADKGILMKRVLDLKPGMIVSGGCKKGADKFAEEIAETLGIPITIFYPKTGNARHMGDVVRAYYARNKLIAQNSDHLIALVAPDRKGGTENTIKYFKNLFNTELWQDHLEIL